MSKHLSRNGLAIFIFISLILHLWGITYGLPAVFLSDESYTVLHVLYMGYARDLNPHGFIYPTLPMYVLMLLYGVYFGLSIIFQIYPASPHELALTILRDPTPLYLIGRLLVVTANVAVIPMVFVAGRRLFSERVGLLATALMVGIYPSVTQAHLIKNEAFLTFFAMATLAVLARAMQHGRLRDYALAGLLAGLGTACKYNGALLAMPLALGALSHADIRLWGKRVIICALCMLAAFVVGTPFVLLDFGSFWSEFKGLSYFSLPRLGSDATTSVIGWWFVLVRELGLGLTVLFLLTPLLLVVRRSLKEIVLFSFPFLHFVVFALASPWKNIHWQNPIFPFLAVGAAVLVVVVTDTLVHNNSRLRLALIATLVVLLLTDPVMRIIQYDQRLSADDTRILAKQWIEKNIPSGTRILTERGKYQSSFGVPLNENPESIEDNYLKGDTLTSEGRVYQGATSYYRLLAEAMRNVKPSYYIVPILYDDFAGQSEVWRRPPPKSLTEYMAVGVQYAVLVSDGSEYRQALNNPRFSDFAKPYVQLYDSIAQYGQLLHRIPNSPERFGPSISIYRIGGAK